MKQTVLQKESFVRQLCSLVDSLRGMKPSEVHMVNVRAKYGKYQIIIGAESLKHHNGNSSGRPLEINGEIHHLFLSPNSISPTPPPSPGNGNLKETVIMRDLKIHLLDENGHGEELSNDHDGEEAIYVHELINLAGKKGKELIDKATQTGELSRAAYQIIQQDILRSIEEDPEESLREIS